MLLADLVLIMQSTSPYHPPVDFHDDMAQVLGKSGQSMMAASHVLRDDRLFEVSDRAREGEGEGGCHEFQNFLGCSKLYCPLKPQSTQHSKVSTRPSRA
jgi:hypothetical protein